MEMPITKPSLVSYADEVDFNQLLENLSRERKNGFIRVTAGSCEGYLLFKNGEEVAASYDTHSRSNAIKEIKKCLDDNRTLVELFDLKNSQVDYLMDINKPYLLDKTSDVDEVIDILKNNKSETLEDAPGASEAPEEPVPKTDIENNKSETSIPSQVEETPQEEAPTDKINKTETTQKPPTSQETASIDTTPEEVSSNMEAATESVEQEKTETIAEPKEIITTSEEEVEPEIETNDQPVTEQEETESEEEPEPESPMDRSELLKKYGIKDINEDDVEDIIESYSGGYISDEDVEKIELTLMNRIKKSVLGFPKIRGAEVMVFLDNNDDLNGTINIITEYQSKGIFSRLMGENKEINNLKRQVVGITELEIRKSFREYPEIIEKFDINVEVS